MGDEGGDTAAPAVVLSAEDTSAALSGLARTLDGTGYALSRCDISGKELTDISALSSYTHIRYLNASSNAISDIKPIAQCTSLLAINIENNQIAALDWGNLQYLQIVKAANNKVAEVATADMPMLRQLDLRENCVASVSGLDSCQNIEQLFLDGNALTSSAGLNAPSLKQITVTNNKLEDVTGFAALTNITQLDLSGNAIAEVAALEPLANTPVVSLTLTGNPVSEVEGYRLKTLRALPQLTQLDGEDVTAEEREEANKPPEAEGGDE